MSVSTDGRIKKSKKNGNFTVVPNEILRKVELSWKAKGLMAYLLGMSDDWIVYKKDLCTRSTDGYDSTIKAFNELVVAGYIEVNKIKGEKGRFTGYEYIIHDTPPSPARDFPEPDSPEPVSPEPENPDLINNSLGIIPNEEIVIDKSIPSGGVKTPPDNTASLPPKNKPVIELPMTERSRLFVAEFNRIKKQVTGSEGKFQSTRSVLDKFKVRIKKYTSKQIVHAINMAFKSKHHIENNFMYLTPEYILRENILERYINVTGEPSSNNSMVY
jgi:hypothetical protein